MHQFNTNSLIHNCLSDYLCLHGIRACLLKSNSYQTSAFQPSENPAEFNENPATFYFVIFWKPSYPALWKSAIRPPVKSKQQTTSVHLTTPTIELRTKNRPNPTFPADPKTAHAPPTATRRAWACSGHRKIVVSSPVRSYCSSASFRVISSSKAYLIIWIAEYF